MCKLARSLGGLGHGLFHEVSRESAVAGLHRQEGVLSGCNQVGQVDLQAMPCDWTESLHGLPTWVRLKAVFST